MPLNTPLKNITRILPAQEKALIKIGLRTVADILYYFPTRYGNSGEIKSIETLRKGDFAVLFGRVQGLETKKAFRKKIPMAEGWLEDDTGKIQLVWFNQPYIAKLVRENSLVRIEGKVGERKSSLYISNPKIESIAHIPEVGSSLFGDEDENHNFLYPVYPETKGVTSNWLYHALQKLFRSGILEEIEDPIPQELLKKYSLPSISTALVWIHSPKKESDALAARKRFAFEEIFEIQIEKQINKIQWQKHSSFVVNTNQTDLDQFTKNFPFPLTQAQKKSIEHIISDFKKNYPMSRLLEGDVGSGKTAVAAAAAFMTINSRPNGKDYGNLQVAYMVPTEILATQHFKSFIEYFTASGIQIGLITGSGAKKFPSKINPTGATDISRSQLLKWVANGEIPILIGTHALIQKTVRFKHLALVIIDEQHRFGTSQRQKLREKEGSIPHLLSMTATPIPRTLALTIYGDLDLSLLDELPPGRKWPDTQIVLPKDREAVYEKIREEIKNGRQAYVICPRIDEPDPDKEMAVQARSVKEEAKRLKKDVFPEFEIETMHGKIKPKDKEKLMNEFKDGKIDILVSTSVVEVGVNVPNATIIVIEGAERFGLAQLHQLRGRVMRSSHQPYCFVFSETKSDKSIERLRSLRTAKSGFELAEFDLAQRGAGELYGKKQWGITDLGMEAIKNIKLVEAARLEAQKIVENDPELKRLPFLKERISTTEDKIHFE